MDSTIDIDRPSDTNMSLKHYLPSLCSPVVTVADPLENVVDEVWMPVAFFVAAPGLFLRLADSRK